jgi:hypothetical protein
VLLLLVYSADGGKDARMLSRADRLAHFETGTPPTPGRLVEVLCEDHAS